MHAEHCAGDCGFIDSVADPPRVAKLQTQPSPLPLIVVRGSGDQVKQDGAQAEPDE